MPEPCPTDAQRYLFDGFPYLLSRVAPCAYVISLLPADWPGERLFKLAQDQVAANRFETCLVLGPTRAEYLRRDGTCSTSSIAPGGGLVFLAPLRLAEDIPASAELHRRRDALASYLDAHQKRVYFFGDLTKGGRSPVHGELARLSREPAKGARPGLERCAECRELHGDCLDPNSLYRGLVMTVRCRCENHNRCARCHELLFERAVWANFYDERADRIIHVPGFVGLRHRCRI